MKNSASDRQLGYLHFTKYSAIDGTKSTSDRRVGGGHRTAVPLSGRLFVIVGQSPLLPRSKLTFCFQRRGVWLVHCFRYGHLCFALVTILANVLVVSRSTMVINT